MPISSNPCWASRVLNSSSSRAPATHPTQASMLRRTSDGSCPRTTTSDTAKRPPGLSTRNASPSTRRLSAVGLPQPSDASTAPSGSPVVSPASYSREVIGSPQQLLFSPSSTRNAAWPYFSRTVSLMSGPLIRSSLSLAAGRPATPGVPAGLHGARKCGDPFERVGVEGVIHPASLAPVGHQPGVLQRLQVNGEPALRRVEHVLQLAHAAFSV